jgi:hypothetical protein
MKMHFKFWLGVTIAVLIMGTLLLLFRPGNHPDFEIPSHARIRNAGAIALALSKYQYDHGGHLPNKLSDLIPRYIDHKNVRYFFPPGSDVVGRLESSGSTNFADAINNEGAYDYLGEGGLRQDLILYERTNFWSTNVDALDIMTITSIFEPKLRLKKDVATRVSEVNSTRQP